VANQQGIGGGGVLLAFIAGAAVGAAVALLYAPASGEETRDYLGQRAREGREKAAEAARQAREHAAEAARQGREILNRQREHLSTAFDRAREQFQGGTSGEQDA
jgi:gas vesicle protein